MGFAFDATHYSTIAKNTDLVVTVECTLNELYLGASKIVKYTRKVIAGDGISVMDKSESKVFEVKPEFNSSTVINYAEQGN